MTTIDHGTCRVTVEPPRATVELVPPAKLTNRTSDLHWDLGEVFSELRGDNSVRVITLTGTDDEFYAPQTRGFLDSEPARRYLMEPSGAWRTFTGVIRTHETMAALEKPIVARVNGDAIGFGSSLVFACDLIVAAEDAIFADIHLGMGEVTPGGPEHGMAPGDGGGALVPMFMAPPKAKEYLMLSKAMGAPELEALGAINYAVPRAQLDAKVDELVDALLRRSAYALAWAKRVANRPIVANLNAALDASVGYEMVSLLQLERSGFVDPLTLD